MNSRPKVFHITHGLGAGGAECLVYELVARLPERGFDAEAITVLGGGPLEALFREAGLKVRIFTRRGAFGWRTFRELVRIFRAEKPDVVHTHLFLADTWGRLAAWIACVPVIISTEHNVNESYTFMHRAVNRLLSFITREHLAVSGEVKRRLMKDEGLSGKKIRVVLNGIDLAAVVPRGGHPFQDIPRLVAVGRLYPQKDYPTLLKALALVKRPWRLSIAGTGPLERELRDLCERLAISPRVQWLGFRDDVPELLARSDVFCFPSRYEGLGLAAIEAAAAGVPIIASDLPALHEVFEKNDVRFVPAGDVSAWAQALNDTLADPVAAVAMATRTMPRVRAAVSIDRMVDAYAAVYRTCLR